VGVLAALLAREKTGRGQYIDLSMTDGVAYIMGHVYSDYFRSGQVPRRGEAASSGGLAQYSVYETADGKYISIAALEAKFFESLCEMLERPDFIGNASRPERQTELRELLDETFRQKTRDEWFELLTAAEIPAGKVYGVDESPEDPQLRARQMFLDLNHERVGPVKQIGLPLKLSETPGSVRSLGPIKGQHTLEILRSLGYGDEEIDALRQDGAVLIAEPL
ncbi:MAG TPA: CaiB/BaiF CoA-transferase family protein, partial [Dehalococcoidia bacterium]|nr:CaiB/BaiF CoA-transferase family protein [Dehalococcoidia bacterium]